MDEDDEDDRPRKKRRSDDEDDYDAPKSRKGRRDDDDDDDRSRKGKKKSGMGLILALAGGGVGLLLVFGLTAFVWPGFLLSGGGANDAGKKVLAVGGIEPLAMMPSDAIVIAGMKPGKVDKKATDAIAKGGFFGPGKEGEELMSLGMSADRIVASLNIIQKKFVVVMFYNAPPDQERFKKQLNAEPAQLINGQTVHVCKNKSNDKGYLCFLTDRVVCFGSTPTDQEFAQLMGNKNGKATFSADAIKMIDQVASSDAWVVFAPDDAMRNDIAAKNGKNPGKGNPKAKANPADDAMKTVLDAKGVSLGVTDVAGSYSISVSLMSKSAEEAGKTKAMIDNYVAQGKELLNAFAAFAKINNIKNDVEKVNIQSQGDMIFATISISPSAINEMQALPAMLGGMPGGGGFGPPGGGFVPPNLPPFPKKR